MRQRQPKIDFSGREVPNWDGGDHHIGGRVDDRQCVIPPISHKGQRPIGGDCDAKGSWPYGNGGADHCIGGRVDDGHRIIVIIRDIGKRLP